MKKLVLLTAAAVATIAMATTAFAATGWQQSTDGRWWYSLTESGGSWYHGTNGVPQWQWLDGNRDGVAECYAFDNDGWMYANTTTPDGYLVNANGAWVSGGVVQTQSTSGSTSSAGVGWRLGANGRWWYATNAAGTTYHVGTPIAPYWAWIDGNGDGISESYAFDALGYMYANTTTPDGYVVNADGAWTVNGVVQTKRSSSSATVRSVSSGGGSSSSSSSSSRTNYASQSFTNLNSKKDAAIAAVDSKVLSNVAITLNSKASNSSGSTTNIAVTADITSGKTVAEVVGEIEKAVSAGGVITSNVSKVTVATTDPITKKEHTITGSNYNDAISKAKDTKDYGGLVLTNDFKVTVTITYSDSYSTEAVITLN